LPKAELKIGLLLTGLLSPVFYFFKSKPLQIERSSLGITFPDLFVMQLVFAKLLLLPTSECLLHSHSHPINFSMQSPASLGCCLLLFFIYRATMFPNTFFIAFMKIQSFFQMNRNEQMLPKIVPLCSFEDNAKN